ncbi:Hypp173 [Branchiostoma lanceolatum]|uniref:Hypp173 protein n=1 Tax=Branchiostoma lanceolatum TaxID=7740 RepID=A0A8J9YJI3_BRALA|nr:Hypp173 [Branchiostoma lanceolatum]
MEKRTVYAFVVLFCVLSNALYGTILVTLSKDSDPSMPSLLCRHSEVKCTNGDPGVRPNFPKESLENLVHYNSCAVVSSSHGLKLHHYGRDIGVIMMLHLCDWVYTYEMVPSSVDRTRLAYYYNETKKMAIHRSHSITTERKYWRALTVTPLEEVDRTGVAVLRGLSQHNCT